MPARVHREARQQHRVRRRSRRPGPAAGPPGSSRPASRPRTSARPAPSYSAPVQVVVRQQHRQQHAHAPRAQRVQQRARAGLARPPRRTRRPCAASRQLRQLQRAPRPARRPSPARHPPSTWPSPRGALAATLACSGSSGRPAGSSVLPYPLICAHISDKLTGASHSATKAPDMVRGMTQSHPRISKAVIPAAGLGTRFLPATKATPKEMLPVVDKPAIQYVVEEAVAAGLVRRPHGHRPQQAPPRGPLRPQLRAGAGPARARATPTGSPRSRSPATWPPCTTSARATPGASATPSCAPPRTSATSPSPSSSATT